MTAGAERANRLGLDGIQAARVHWNLSPAALYEEAIRRGEGSGCGRRPARVPDRTAYRPLAERQVHRPRVVQRIGNCLGQRSTARSSRHSSTRCITTC